MTSVLKRRLIETGLRLFGTSIWWLRSPNTGNANNVYNVNTSGALNNNNANNTNGVAPDRM